jgi:hypothetical protein
MVATAALEVVGPDQRSWSAPDHMTHSGTVTVTSTLGAGTKVRLTLPPAHES